MNNVELIVDKGLFLGQSDFNFSLPDSFETIANFLKTIKEYRDYAHPDTPEWVEYIQEFFHVLGFHTEQIASRLISLNDIGTQNTPKALVMLIAPGENFDEIIPTLDWLSYLFYAANYHHVNWGILTNGIEMRVFDFKRKDYKQTFFLANLDGIVQDGRLDSFFTIYKIFSYMRGRKGESLSTQRKPRKSTQPASPRSSEYDLSFHTSNSTDEIVLVFETLRTKILALSASVIEKPKKKTVNYIENKTFCCVHFQ